MDKINSAGIKHSPGTKDQNLLITGNINFIFFDKLNFNPFKNALANGHITG
jgi:hypothetical protein